MGNLFSSVKDAVSARNAAEFYGIHVNRSGMARCPFHNDRTPSMKVDRRFHCFGCGADGDVIDFAARLFGLGNKEAAEKLASDFGVSYDSGFHHRQSRQKPHVIRKNQRQLREEAERNFYRILTDYYHLMRQWKEGRAPKAPDEEWDSYFCEALRNLDKVVYLLDSFLEADEEERTGIMNQYGKTVKQYEERSKAFRKEIMESGERKVARSIEERIRSFKSGGIERTADDCRIIASGHDDHGSSGITGEDWEGTGKELRVERRNDPVL